MKKINYIKTTLLSLTAMALLSSCLKDKRYIDFAASKPLVDFPAAAYTGEFNVAGVPAGNAAAVYTFPVNISSPSTLSAPVTVTIVLDTAAITAYNTANSLIGTNQYHVLPAADYTVSSYTVTIPANTRMANLSVTINAVLVDTASHYVLPFTIKSASNGVTVDQFHTILYNVAVKNAYDDSYTETGYKFHPTVGASHALTGSIPVSTVSTVTSNTYVGDLGGSGYTFNFDTNGSVVSNWVATGATPPAPASGFYTADNPGGVAYTTPADATTGISPQPGTTPYVQTTYNNSYNATTGTFYLHYGYGGGSSSQNGWTRNFYVKMVAQ